jgi:hypothetical protein
MPNLFRTGADAMEPQQRDQRGQAGIARARLAVLGGHLWHIGQVKKIHMGGDAGAILHVGRHNLLFEYPIIFGRRDREIAAPTLAKMSQAFRSL